MWFIFQHTVVSPAVHTLLPSVLQRLDSRGIEALILILKKALNCRYDHLIDPILLPSQVLLFSCGGTEIVRWSTSGEYGGWSTSSKPKSITSAIAITDLCAGLQASEGSEQTKHWRGKPLFTNNRLPLQCFVSSEASDAPDCRSNVLVKQDSFRQVFQAVSEMSQVLLFKVLNYLSSVGLSRMNQCS